MSIKNGDVSIFRGNAAGRMKRPHFYYLENGPSDRRRYDDKEIHPLDA
jgi:hypothetical protein